MSFFKWLNLKSFWRRAFTDNSGPRQRARIGIELLEDRSTPSTSGTVLLINLPPGPVPVVTTPPSTLNPPPGLITLPVTPTGETTLTFHVNYAPAVTKQPVSQTVFAGTKVTFTAAAIGSPAPTVQWQVSTNDGLSWTNLKNGTGVQGVTTDTLTVTATNAQNGQQFRAVFTNTLPGNPSVASHAAVLTVQTLTRR